MTTSNNATPSADAVAEIAARLQSRANNLNEGKERDYLTASLLEDAKDLIERQQSALAARPAQPVGEWIAKPTGNGWWWHQESGGDNPKPLLVVGSEVSRQCFGEVAADEELGREEYWEMTSVEQIPGKWMALAPPAASTMASAGVDTLIAADGRSYNPARALKSLSRLWAEPESAGAELLYAIAVIELLVAKHGPLRQAGGGEDTALLDFLEDPKNWDKTLSCWNVDEQVNNGWTFGVPFEHPTHQGKTARQAIRAAMASAQGDGK